MRSIVTLFACLLGIGCAAAQGPIVTYGLRDDIIFSEYTGNCGGTSSMNVDIYYEYIQEIVYSGACTQDPQFGDICQFVKDTSPEIYSFALPPGYQFMEVTVYHWFSEDPIIACNVGCPAPGTERSPVDHTVVPILESCGS